ncbi:MAG: hypothetical protein AB4352_00400 [Hormoscilla sp.]
MIRYLKLLQIIPVTIVSWGIFWGLTGPIAWSLESSQEEMAEVDSTKAEDLLLSGETEILLSETWQFNQKIDDRREIAQLGDDAGTSGFAIVPKAGTLGLGADVVAQIIPHLNGRVGISGLGIDVEVSSDEIDYDGDVNLGGVPLLLDWYPAKSGFRVTGGLVINNNEIDLDAKGRDEDRTITIGDRSFTVNDVGDLEGEVEFNDIAPYIGIGFGNPVKPGRQWGFTVDLGIMFQGAGDVNIRATNASQAALDLGLNEQLEREEDDIQDEVDNFKVYPILQIGVTYQF